MTPRPPCWGCGHVTLPRRTRYGLCEACHQRWERAGRPDTVPPPYTGEPTPARRAARERFQKAGAAATSAAAQARLNEYARLRAKGRPRAAAAAWIGVTVRTAYRYEARLRAEKGART